MYKYELHCHTSEGSRCAKTSAADMIEFYKKCGYTGVVITDHFFNGNCTVPKELPWEEKVELYCKGYENAKKRGDEIGVDVFFGWEFGGDFVTLGLSPEWLKNRKDLDKLTANEYFEEIHNAGGYIIHAHPFRESPYTKALRIFPRNVDAMETINAGNTDFQNSVADYIAEKYKVTKAAGSDKHSDELKNIAAVEFDFKPETLDELIEAMRNNRHAVKEYDLFEKDGKIELKEHIQVIED